MDPNRCWRDLLEAYAVRNHELAVELAQALLDWLAQRGFPPQIVKQSGLPNGWHHELAYRACKYILAHPRRPPRKRRRRKRSAEET